MIKRLNTIQTREKLNEVYAVDEVGPGGAHHKYQVILEPMQVLLDLEFQKGPRHDIKSQHGIIDSDLLEIVRHRLKCFQAGPYASEYNEHALKHIEEALRAMNARVEDRINRNVLGTNVK